MHISQHTLFGAATMMSAGVLAAGGSAGCGKTPSVDPGHHHVRTVNSSKGGGTREFILAIPSNYDSSKPVPLILSFHGNSRNMTNQLYLSEFIDEQWNPNAISVYPQGVNNMWEGAPYDKSGPDDLAFTADLIDALSNELCLDTTRVYCSGKSVGGGFCNVLACDAELSKRFAAIAPVSGAYYTTPAGKPFNTECHPARGSMPVLEFHGLADKTIPYTGGEHRGVDLRTVPDWAQAWADMDGCNGTKPTEQDTFNGNVKHYTWNCGNSTAGAAVVQHYAIEGLAHTWPSTGWNPDNDGHGTYINATPLIVDFFNKYSLPEPPVTPKPTVSGTQSVKRHHARMF